jgi:hypothetical protein
MSKHVGFGLQSTVVSTNVADRFAVQGRAGIMRLIPLCTFLFMGLMYREVRAVTPDRHVIQTSWARL